LGWYLEEKRAQAEAMRGLISEGGGKTGKRL